MRVILELVSGPQAGRRIHLLRNQRVQVGNTSWADFVVRDDQKMAGQHFALETDTRSCRLRDMAGGGATVLNGQPVTELVVLKSGDQISAGDSRFIVQIEGGETPAATEAAPPVSANRGAVPPPMSSVAKSAPAPATAKPERTFEREECDSGAWHYFGNTANCSPAELVQQLNALWPLHFMVDFRRAKAPPPPNVAELPMLFDWLGEPGRQFSPVVLAAEALPAPDQFVQQGWGTDGLVGLFTTQSAEDVVAHLRRNVRIGSDRVVGICWPGILGQILSHYREDFVRKILSITATVLVEGGEAGAEWHLYSLSPLDETLMAMGFKLVVPEEAMA